MPGPDAPDEARRFAANCGLSLAPTLAYEWGMEHPCDTAPRAEPILQPCARRTAGLPVRRREPWSCLCWSGLRSAILAAMTVSLPAHAPRAPPAKGPAGEPTAASSAAAAKIADIFSQVGDQIY